MLRFYYCHRGFYNLFPLCIENILVEQESGSPAFHPQTAPHLLPQPQWGKIGDLDPTNNRVDTLLLHGAERNSCFVAELMASMFEIMQIVSIIHYPLRVYLVIADLQR